MQAPSPGVFTLAAHWKCPGGAYKTPGAWAHPRRVGFPWSEIGLAIPIFKTPPQAILTYSQG